MADIRLEPLARHHLAATLRWVNDPEGMRLLNRAALVAADEHERWFSAMTTRRDCRYFAVMHGDAHVGNVWLWDIDTRHQRAEVRILIGERAAIGQGAGTAALERLASIAFGDMALRRLYAYVLEINPRARRAFEKAGFRLEGRLREDRVSDGRFVDVDLLARLRGDAT